MYVPHVVAQLFSWDVVSTIDESDYVDAPFTSWDVAIDTEESNDIALLTWDAVSELLSWDILPLVPDTLDSGSLADIVDNSITDSSVNTVRPPSIDENVFSWDILSTWTTPDIVNSWSSADDVIDQQYFDRAFDKWVFHTQIFDLQTILSLLWLYTWDVSGVYDDMTIQAVYHYQLFKNLLTSEDDVGLRWYFGPATRQLFNQEYILYKQNLLQEIADIFALPSKEILLQQAKAYFLAHAYSLQNIFGTWVFVGDHDIDFSVLSWQLLMPLIFQSENTLSGYIAEVKFEHGTILKTEEWDIFTWMLAAPQFLNTSVAAEITGQTILSVLDIWGNEEKLVLEDASWSTVSSLVTIPVPWQQEGDIVQINYSHDGETWIYMTSQEVFLDNGQPFVSFETTHFTVFSIGLPVGSFFINNNDFSTSTTSVTLQMNVSGATHMRFANTWTSLTWASWLTYATWYNWILSSVNGSQTVYAQFSGTYGTQILIDTILLDTTLNGANLKFALNGSMNGTEVLDNSSNANNFSGVLGVTNPTLTGEQVLWFNGTQYAQRNNAAWLTGYPFTFSAWVNTSRPTTSANQPIVYVGNSGVTNVSYGLYINTTWYPVIAASNTTSYLGTSQEKMSTWTWYHIVWVFASATSRILYVNGNQVATNTSSVLFSWHINPQLRVWRYVGSLGNYFSGYIDEVRLYNKTLSVYEIRNMYKARIQNEPPIQYLNVGTFTINSGESNTYTTGVTLVSTVTGMTHMRFANTTWDLTSASWVAYTGMYARSLNGGVGNKIVYAQYSGLGGIWETQDNIFLDSIANANLKFLLDGQMNGTRVLDATTNANYFTGISSLTSIVMTWERVLSLNGTSQYAERTGAGVWITAYPFTMSAWINARTIASTDTIMSMWNSAKTTMYYGIQLVNGAPSIVASNTTAVTTTTTRIIGTGEWYHIVWVFNSGTNRQIYINGEFYANSATTSAPYAATNSRIRVWRNANSTTTNYFDGYVDDASLYNKALSPAEIKTLYTNRTNRVTIPTARVVYDITWATSSNVVATLTGMSESITLLNNWWSLNYTFTGNGSFTFLFRDGDGNIGSTIAYVNWITPSSATWTLAIFSPASFAFGSTWASILSKNLEKYFTGTDDYFQVEDGVWSDNGYYTTLSFSNLQYTTYTIPKENIYVKTVGGIVLLSGTANASVVSAITWVYLSAWSPLTFIKRDAWANSNKTGKYWSHIAVNIVIPAQQQPANYTGTIIYTLY